ncbi:integrase core domain-containing protein [Candidatus Flexifilum breve]|uniref:integrase core domain-containing protein n=1 Tax=Candidatus Flexifilum breve TaxID=3140694 RepID=UPI00331307B9
MRFLCCVGVEPDVVQPGKPQHKPFVERSIRTLKHECLCVNPPKDWREAADQLQIYRDFYNHERANQSLACGNRPPGQAFPQLPVLPPSRTWSTRYLAHPLSSSPVSSAGWTQWHYLRRTIRLLRWLCACWNPSGCLARCHTQSISCSSGRYAVM